MEQVRGALLIFSAIVLAALMLATLLAIKRRNMTKA